VTELGVIIPTLNDAATLPATLDALARMAVEANLATEVLVVDGGSTDDTAALAAAAGSSHPLLHLRVLVLHTKKRANGFGSLVRYGLAYSSARWCALASADNSDPIDLLPRMVRELQSGQSLVIMSRFAETEEPQNVARRFRVYQRIYRAGIRLLLGKSVSDSTNGFRAFDRKLVLALGLSSNRFSICPEMTFKVLLSGGEIGYVPGTPTRAPGDVAPKFRLPREVLGYAHVLVRAGLHRAGLSWF
jgi:dolichol-phosphate mannosyltransferase